MSGLSDQARAKINEYLPRYPSKQAVTLPALHIVQEETRCVSHAAVEQIAKILDLSPAQVHDTASFYGFFRSEDRPLGRQRVWVCRSLPCMLRGGEELLAALAQRWNILPGQTTSDGQITLEVAECLGACDGAPCILINDELSLHVDAETIDQRLEERP
ncbi:NAD(P)H-dependent oxidoreductase subunit E [bacterium]|jgi:NADH-quinone oxidoreductase subunit E|nr:NAD(P)H-dependent oxidoreductase subunit E [bacterium]